MTEKTDLQRVVALAELLVQRKEAQEAAEGLLSKLKAEIMRLEREDLPALMAEVGLSTLTLESGQSISIKEEVEAKIAEANKSAAFAWLNERGFGGIIKTKVGIEFARGEHDVAVQATRAIAGIYPGHDVALDETVHPQTLKAFVKERLAAGDALPFDVFGVFTYSKAVVKD
jgi:hypothetical protein